MRGPDGALWFCEYTGQRIRKVTPDGTIHTMAGSGKKGYSGDGGPALQATFNLPHEIRFDKEGNYYIADMTNHAIRRVDAKTGVITTFAGTGTAGYSGDGGPANKAQLKQPHSIQFGADGTLYICDIGNNVIRKVDMKTGTISTFAGTGKPGDTPDGAPIAGTPLKGPRSLDVDKDGNLWLVTREGNQVLQARSQGRASIQHIAGTGKKGFTGNGGPAKLATLSGPKGIAIDAEGNAWLADTESHSRAHGEREDRQPRTHRRHRRKRRRSRWRSAQVQDGAAARHLRGRRRLRLTSATARRTGCACCGRNKGDAALSRKLRLAFMNLMPSTTAHRERPVCSSISQ